jgi:DNA-directed RNA polymerase specialized sigma24 family protein
MDKTTPRFEDHVGLTHKLAKRMFAWAQSFQVSMDYEDAFQEVSVAFVKAAEGYKPETGNAFSTYYTFCAKTHFKKFMEKEMGRTNRHLDRATGQISGAGMVSVDDMRFEDDTDPYEVLDAGVHHSPEAAMELKQELAERYAKLKPVARTMFDWMTQPPQELIDELGRIRAHHNEKPGALELPTIREIGDFMVLGGLSAGQVSDAARQLKNIANAL